MDDVPPGMGADAFPETTEPKTTEWGNMQKFLMSVALLVLSASLVQAQPVNPDYIFRVVGSAGPQGSVRDAAMILDSSAGIDLQGWSLGVCHDTSLLTILDIVSGADAEVSNNGSPPDFSAIQLLPDGATIGVAVSFVGLGMPPGVNEIAVMTYSLDGAEGSIATVEPCATLGLPPVDAVIQDVTTASWIPVNEPGAIEIGGVEPTILRCGSATGVPGGTVGLTVTLTNPEALAEGFAYALSHEAGAVTPVDVSPGVAISSFNGGVGPDYFEANLSPSGPGVGTTVGCVFDFEAAITLPIGVDQVIAVHNYQVSAAAADGQEIAISFSSQIGSPPVQNLISVGGLPLVPETENGLITVDGDPTAVPLRRGDVNEDSIVDLSDAIFLARWLFGVGPMGTCDDAADVDDNGVLQGLLDSTFLLNYLFLNGTPPVAPFPACGIDVNNTDTLQCTSYTGC